MVNTKRLHLPDFNQQYEMLDNFKIGLIFNKDS